MGLRRVAPDSTSAPPLLVLPTGGASGGAGAGGQGVAVGGLQGVGVELQTRRAGVPRPHVLAIFFLLGVLLLWTLKVDTVEDLEGRERTRE